MSKVQQKSQRDNDRQSIVRMAVINWLLSQNVQPNCIATDVDANGAHERFDLVSVNVGKIPRSSTKKINYQALFSTAAFICYADRDECWPECANSNEIASELAELREQRMKLEEEIRATEPDLKDNAVLFEELAVWNYEKSTNPQYKNLAKSINWLESILYMGNRVERIMANPLADKSYIVVPDNAIQPNEINENWGLLWVADDGTVTVKREATQMPVSENVRLGLVKHCMEASLRKICSFVSSKSHKAKRKASKAEINNKK